MTTESAKIAGIILLVLPYAKSYKHQTRCKIWADESDLLYILSMHLRKCYFLSLNYKLDI